MRTTFAILLLLQTLAISQAKEVIVLQNEGRIEGETIADENLPKTQRRIKTPAGGQIVIDTTAIKQTIIVGKDESEYENLRRIAPDTVEGQWKLAEWCREKKMNKQRVPHLERVIALDTNHLQARLALGYTQSHGRWLRQEDRKKEQGYVLYKGEWKLPQEIELLEQQAQGKANEREWYAKLNRLKADYINGTPNKSAEAWQKLTSIDDPAAVPAILQEMKAEKLPRMLRAYIEALGRISNGAALRTLVDLAMGSATDQYQELALEQLKKGKNPDIAILIAGELKSKDNKRVNRAGYALGELGDPSVIPAMIDSLITKHKFQISSGDNGQMSAGFGSGGSGFSAGGKAQIIEQALENFQVLTALNKLSGQNFDYNQAAWRTWYEANRAKPVIAGRRD
jgi:hypothetical protein